MQEKIEKIKKIEKIEKIKSPRNKTITLTDKEISSYLQSDIVLQKVKKALSIEKIKNKIINADFFETSKFLPDSFVDLLILDPPYNLTKQFGLSSFKKLSVEDYSLYLDSIITALLHTLKPTASIYICSDWLSSISIPSIASKYFKIQNRITWQREKGRSSKKNWKNSYEDIWFYTNSNDFTFNPLFLRRKVLAPYKENGKPKDWSESDAGKFRDTAMSNFWDDITIPYWSMSENTTHPTQKPEKLIAKLILASSNENDFVFDPFCGSGTSAVVADKLGRNYLGIELDPYYTATSIYRLNKNDKQIQGMSADGTFWQRNLLPK